MYNLVAMTAWRIRGEDWVKFNYKKGTKKTLKTLEQSTFFRRNGRKLVQNKDKANEAEAKETKTSEVQKARVDAKKAE